MALNKKNTNINEKKIKYFFDMLNEATTKLHEISNIIKSKKMTKKIRNIKLELEGENDGVC